MLPAHLGDRLSAFELVRERLDTARAQCLQLAPPGGEDVAPLGRVRCRPLRRLRCRPLRRLRWRGGTLAGAHLATSILVTLSFRLPRGVAITTSSPRLRPIRALPTGDSLESFISAGLASADPTIVYLTDLPFSSLTWTTEPTPTTSLV